MNARTLVRETFKARDLLQSTADLDQLARQAQRANSGLYKFAAAFAEEIGGTFEIAPNKRLSTAFEKAVNEYQGDFRKLRDLSRGKIVVDTVEQIEHAQKILDRNNPSKFLMSQAEKGYLVCQFKDRFAEPTSSGYRAGLMTVLVPFSLGGGHKSELQLQHKGMEDAANMSHILYEQARSITRDFDNAVLPPEQAETLFQLQNARRELHEEAAQRLGLTRLQTRETPQVARPMTLH